MPRASRSIETLQSRICSWIAARNTLPVASRSILPESVAPDLSPEERETLACIAKTLGYRRAFRRLLVAADAD